MTERTTGYSLLILGIVIMIFATFQIISVFTGKANPIPLFQVEEVVDEKESSSSSNIFLDQLQNFSGQNINIDQLPRMQIIDPAVLNRILNLTVYYLIMQFLLGLGYKLASLGTQLVRPIQVQMKNRTFESFTQNKDTLT